MRIPPVLLIVGSALVLSAVAIGAVGMGRTAGMPGAPGFANGSGPAMMGRTGPGGAFGGAMGTGEMMGGVGPGGDSMGVVGPGGMMAGLSGQLPSSALPISIDQAQKKVEQYLAGRGNSDLKLDELVQFQNNFYAGVSEKSTGVVAFALLVNPVTGAVGPEPGANMMWNSKYGMAAGGMFGTRASTATMPISSEQAQKIAQSWLDANLAGSSANSPDRYYGFYTVDFNKDGQLSGMLSVNGSSGAVWYHSWHGAFIQAKQLAP